LKKRELKSYGILQPLNLKYLVPPSPPSKIAPLVVKKTRVADPLQFYADPDPAFHFNADPDPDAATQQSDANLR